MEATISVSGLRKRFGSTVALDGMSFTVGPGQVTGFIGPNGAGKSTTMRVILGLDAAEAGTALVGGRLYRTLRHPLCHLGSLLDAGALQPSRSARNHLLWLAHSQGLPARRVDEVVEQAGLTSVIRRKAGGFSLGMRQRLGIAAALLGDPPVLMLDEPFNGMDPEGIVWMRGFLRGLGCPGDPAKLSLTGVQFGQAVVAILAVLAISGEYSISMIRVTLAAVPRRAAVLAAKAAVVTGLVLVTGTIGVLASVLAGRLMLPGHGFSPTRGYALVSLSDATVLRAAAGSVLYLALISLLSLGAATVIRESGFAIGAVLALLYVFPIIASVVTDPHWERHLQQIAPMTAGLDIQATTGLSNLPLSPWAGLGVLAAWAGGALLAGGLVLRLRDA